MKIMDLEWMDGFICMSVTKPVPLCKFPDSDKLAKMSKCRFGPTSKSSIHEGSNIVFVRTILERC